MKSKSNSKKQRSSTDRISSLPDSVICHILSFLPTKDTVATSILSKRWKPLWLSVFTLDFTNQTVCMKTTTLCSHVYSVMLSRDNTLPIRSFRLRCSGFPYHEPNQINQLITAAIRRRTEILQLNMMFGTFDMKLASNIFTCRTLTVLKLKRLTIMDDIPQINNNISLIKTLHLHKVYFYNHKQITDFLLSFPILEELQTNNASLHPWREFIIPIQKTAQDKIKYFPNLVTAKLSDSKRIPLFLLSRARSLSIKLTYPHSVQVPIFYNLTQMELFSKLNHKSWPKKWMLEMLQHSPKLQHLIIHEEVENGNHDEEDIWEDPKIVPECLSSQLKTCLFKNYRGKSGVTLTKLVRVIVIAAIQRRTETRIIEDTSQNRNEVQLSAVQGYTSNIYRSHPMPVMVLASSLAIVILLCPSLIRIKVETRPEKVSHSFNTEKVGLGSNAAEVQQFFYSHRTPFYRIEQVLC